MKKKKRGAVPEPPVAQTKYMYSVLLSIAWNPGTTLSEIAAYHSDPEIKTVLKRLVDLGLANMSTLSIRDSTKFFVVKK